MLEKDWDGSPVLDLIKSIIFNEELVTWKDPVIQREALLTVDKLISELDTLNYTPDDEAIEVYEVLENELAAFYEPEVETIDEEEEDEDDLDDDDEDEEDLDALDENEDE